jgi:hypothetical protein
MSLNFADHSISAMQGFLHAAKTYDMWPPALLPI